jgi:hypothetical protein
VLSKYVRELAGNKVFSVPFLSLARALRSAVHAEIAAYDVTSGGVHERSRHSPYLSDKNERKGVSDKIQEKHVVFTSKILIFVFSVNWSFSFIFHLQRLLLLLLLLHFSFRFFFLL